MAKELQISELHGDIHKLHCIPCLPQGTQAKPKQGCKESSLESKISGLGCRYALTVNLFIHHSEFKTTSINYIPENHFGSHLQEGNFRELLDWLADEWRDIFWVNRSLFYQRGMFSGILIQSVTGLISTSLWEVLAAYDEVSPIIPSNRVFQIYSHSTPHKKDNPYTNMSKLINFLD